ncbi:MAG: hypothetical protein AAF799_15750 [Myxococcota bacterium]
MRLNYASTSSLIVAGLLVVGCADDSAPASSADGSSGTTTGEAPGTTTGESADSGSGVLEGGGSSSEGGEESTGEPPTEVRFGGTIQDFFAMGPIVDAQISVLGMPELETTSNASGDWEFEALPVNITDRFIVADTDNYWGGVLQFETGLEGVDDFELSQVSLDVIDLQVNALQAQDKTVMLDEERAVLLVAIQQNTATGATVTLDPPPEPNTYYAPNSDGQPILNTSDIEWSLYPVAVFFNVEPGPEGTYELTVDHPERECTVLDSQPPTFARHVNLLFVDCPPPE